MTHIPIAISTNNLTKEFGKFTAVDMVSIEIKRGGIFSLLGTNGAGKTTTIRMLCCLAKPTSGDASVMGHSIASNPQAIKRLIGVSPQETAIAERLTAWENLMLMGGVSGLSKGESKGRALKLMDTMGIENRKDLSKNLSGGLKRRLSIALALMSDPQVLFLDEPTLGLDPHARRSVWSYIERLRNNKTILLTTHYLEEADSLADSLAIMNRGRIVESGTPSELKRRYAGNQTLSIKGDNISADTIASLTGKGLKAELIREGVNIAGKEIDFYSIIEILRQNGVQMKGVQMKEPTLDDVFIRLTGKGVPQ